MKNHPSHNAMLQTQDNNGNVLCLKKTLNTLKENICLSTHNMINGQFQNILKIKCLQKGSSGETPKNCTTDEMNAIQNYR